MLLGASNTSQGVGKVRFRGTYTAHNAKQRQADYGCAAGFTGASTVSLSLARAIDNLSVTREGIVIAILGEWGSGKTRVINLVCRYLLHLEMERASQSPLGFEAAPSLRTLAQLEEMAEAFEPIEPWITYLYTLQNNIVRAG